MQVWVRTFGAIWLCLLSSTALATRFNCVDAFEAGAGDRLDQMQWAMDVAHWDGGTPSERLARLIKNKDFIPENATVHIAGPGQNPHEWMVLRLLRPDIKVVVFFENDRQKQEHQSQENFEAAWSMLEDNHAPLLQQSAFTKNQMWDMVTKSDRSEDLLFVKDLANRNLPSGQAIPKADFFFAMSPVGGATQFAHQLKPGASGWVTTSLQEAFAIRSDNGITRIGWRPVERTDLAMFLAAPNQRSPRSGAAHNQLFSGVGRNVRARPFLIHYPEQNQP